MLIAHLVDSADDEDTTLGVERNVVYLLEAQRLRGYQVSLILPAPGAFSDLCAELGIPMVIAPELDAPGRGLDGPDDRTMRELTERFQELGPDLIHCHSLGVASNAIPVANRLGIPVVFDCEMSGLVTAAQRVGMRFATICCCQKSFDEFMKDGVEDVYFVPTGTEVVTAAPPSRSTGTSLIFVGSLQVRKGLDVALLAMTELRRRRAERGERCPVLNIYGTGDEAMYLQEIAAIFGLDDVVTFHGFQSNVLESCPSSDILLLPSRLEHAPLVVLEAMSRGMAVVATDVGDVATMIPDDRFGRVIPAGAVLGLVDAVESMLADVEAGGFDPGASIERHRTLYSTEILADNTCAVYDQVLPAASTAGHTTGSMT